MKAYKDYMDRISVDEEQHKKLLAALNAAEKAPAEPLPAPVHKKKKLLRFALPAAAAVLALVLLPGLPLFTRKSADAYNKEQIQSSWLYAQEQQSHLSKEKDAVSDGINAFREEAAKGTLACSPVTDADSVEEENRTEPLAEGVSAQTVSVKLSPEVAAEAEAMVKSLSFTVSEKPQAGIHFELCGIVYCYEQESRLLFPEGGTAAALLSEEESAKLSALLELP